MRKITFLIAGLFIITILQAQVSKNLNITAGGLSLAMDSAEKSTITDLILTGSLDARDFKTLRDSMPALLNIDMADADVNAYSGSYGPAGTGSISYVENRIPDYSFYNPVNYFGKRLVNVILPSSVTSIGHDAFAYCLDLAEITLPSSLLTIEFTAFRYCGHLIKADLPASLITVQGYAFLNCPGLISLSIPTNVSEIGAYAYFGCTGLDSVYIPGSVTAIGECAFGGCHANLTIDPDNPGYSVLDGVLFNKDMTSLFYCPVSKPGEYVVPSTVKTIWTRSFYGCNNLTGISIPESVTAFQSMSFMGCSGLISFHIPSSVSQIEFYAFTDCVCPITVDESNDDYAAVDGVLFNYSRSRLIYCPPSKTGDYVLPETVAEIESSAFNKCRHLTSISIPGSVMTIGFNVFTDCNGLQSLHMAGTVPVDFSSNPGAFSGVPVETITLYVPEGRKAAYQSAPEWNKFVHVIEGNGFWLSVDEINASSAPQDSIIIFVTSNTEWQASSSVFWIIVSPEIATTGNDTLIVSMPENDRLNERNGTITFYATGAMPQTIHVTQNGRPTVIPEIAKKQLCIYPNPADQILYFNPGKEPVLISIFDSRGELLIKKQIKDGQVNVSGLKPGVYTIFMEGSGETASGRFVKL